MSDASRRAILSVSQPDGEALDAVFAGRRGESTAKSSSLSAEQAERAARAEQVLSVLDEYRVEPAPQNLVDRTMARIWESQQRRRFDHQIADLAAPSVRFGWYELGAVAASLLIMACLALPILARHQGNAQRIACASGMQSTASAMRRYATDHEGALPRGKVGQGTPWYQVGGAVAPNGSVQSNSRHLYLLIRNRYMDPRTLSCPANPHAPRDPDPDAFDWNNHDELSYSYQNQFSVRVIRMDQRPDMSILADKNPMFLIVPGQPLTRRDGVTVNSPSRSHRNRQNVPIGQNVLSADGAIRWLEDPIINGDNIWTISGRSDYNGNEVPTDPGDSHLIQ